MTKEKKPNELIILDRCKTQLATITDLPSLLEIRDKAMAIANFQKARDGGYETSNYGKSIAALAEAQGGRVIKEMQKEGKLPSQGSGRPKKVSVDATHTLDDLGITRDESSRMQKAAVVLEESPEWFDEHLLECNETRRDFTQQAVIRKGSEIANAKTGNHKPKTPRGKYDAIIIDPPWPMKKIERDERPNQADFPYPTITEDELSALVLPSADNCHLWLWTTHKFLPMAFRLLPTWGFGYICTFVWHKPGGFQPIKLPQYNCEFALYARKGSPTFSSTKDFPVCFNAPRGEHSEKPGEFYDMVRRVTQGKRLDMFNRRKISGFKGCGNETVNT